jgi:hypothetical protein
VIAIGFLRWPMALVMAVLTPLSILTAARHGR